MEAGEYKLAIYKPGKYVVKIVEIEVAADDVNIGEHKMWLYGDVNYDGNVLPNDALQINRYANLMSSIFVSGSEQDKIDRLLAADVNGDENILPNDALQINRYANLLTSIFDTFS
ncbi:MAG: hypothetical protein IJM98_06610 [Oscillospiraceae bacterium]|nr:hypothetical protein [Oscillospiraceae bacterium]